MCARQNIKRCVLLSTAVATGQVQPAIPDSTAMLDPC